MTSRKAAFKDDETHNKRQRVVDTADIAPASFSSLNNDCVLSILSFLPLDDINTFGTVSRRYRQIRRHESLDQTRVATIIFSRSRQRSSSCQLLGEILHAASRVLSANYTHLKIVGLEVLKYAGSTQIERLPHVTKLELIALSPSGSLENAPISVHAHIVLSSYLHNVEQLVLNGVRIGMRMPRVFTSLLTRLAELSHVGGGRIDLRGDYPAVTGLALDNCCFVYTYSGYLISMSGMKEHALNLLSNGDYDESCIMCVCQRLQRLSMKGASWTVSTYHGNTNKFAFLAEPIPQEMLIKMVRCHRRLRWLRSDLSEENVAMLKQERPEITFVSE